MRANFIVLLAKISSISKFCLDLWQDFRAFDTKDVFSSREVHLYSLLSLHLRINNVLGVALRLLQLQLKVIRVQYDLGVDPVQRF